MTWDSDRNCASDFAAADRRAIMETEEATRCTVQCSRCSCPRAGPGESRRWPQCLTRLACWGCRLFATHSDKVLRLQQSRLGRRKWEPHKDGVPGSARSAVEHRSGDSGGRWWWRCC